MKRCNLCIHNSVCLHKKMLREFIDTLIQKNIRISDGQEMLHDMKRALAQYCVYYESNK